MIDLRAFDNNGYIINQLFLNNIKCGSYPSSKNGCGWVAIFNIMKILNDEKPYTEILTDLTPYICFKGRLGIRLKTIEKYLTKHNYKFKKALFKSKFESLAKDSVGGIIYYGTATSYHYTTYKNLGNGNFHFLNSVYGRYDDIMTMQEFFEKRVKQPIMHLVAVTGKN